MWWLKKWIILCPNNYCTGIPSPFNVHICDPKKYSIQISVLFWGVPFSSSLYPQSETGFKPVLSFTFNRMKMHLSFFFQRIRWNLIPKTEGARNFFYTRRNRNKMAAKPAPLPSTIVFWRLEVSIGLFWFTFMPFSYNGVKKQSRI